MVVDMSGLFAHRVPRLIIRAVILPAILATSLVVGAPAQAADRRVVGISPGADLLWLSNNDLATELDLYKATGMTWVRVDFDWPSIETSKGAFNWSST